MLSRRRALVALFSAFVMVAWLAPDIQAQTKTIDGTWKWTQTGFGGRRAGGGGAGGPGGGGGNRGPASQPAAGAPTSQPGAGAGGPGGAGRAGGRGGQPREYSLTLKQDGEKVTGKIIGANFQDPTAAMDIKEGTIKANELTFKIERVLGEITITTTYKGKLDGDTITGTSLGSQGFGGQEPQPVEWIAKRDVPAAK